jgi:hypothetical protein
VRRFFVELELRGAGVLFARELACTSEEEEALRAEGIVDDAALADRWECSEIGCARKVVHTEDGFVAVCTRESDFCETVVLAREQLRQVHVSLSGLVAVVRRELRIEEPHGAGREGAARDGSEPLYLGEQGTASPRDVFLELRPRPTSLAPFLALREHAPRPTLVLVPALASLGSEMIVRHAAGAKVEIDALGEALAVRGGRIRAAPRLRTARPPRAVVAVGAAVAATTQGSTATLVPKARRWSHLTILAIDKHTVLVKVGWRRQRLTHVDLDMAHGKSRVPTTLWLMLLAICAGHGQFRWDQFGNGKFKNVKPLMTKLREKLCAAFGVDENPFHRFSYSQGWRPKFQAGMWSADDESSAPERPTWSAAREADDAHAAESAWAVAFEDWEGKALPGKATRAPRED